MVKILYIYIYIISYTLYYLYIYIIYIYKQKLVDDTQSAQHAQGKEYKTYTVTSRR